MVVIAPATSSYGRSVNLLLDTLAQREAVLKISELKLFTLFQKSPIPIALSKLPSGTFVDVNEAYVRTFGHSRNEAIGKNSLELGIYRDPMARTHNIEEVEKHGAIRNQKTVLYTKAGEARIFLKHLDKVMIEDEPYVISSVQDITESEQLAAALRESEEKFRKITESAHDAIVMMGPDQCISLWNPAAERLFGFTSTEAIGRELHPLLAPVETHQAWKQGYQHFVQTGTGPLIGKVNEVTALCKGGAAISVEVSLAPIQIQGQWHAIGIFRDITERKQAEAQIHNLAFYDPLTQLPNRRLLSDRLMQVTAASKRSNRYAALMLLDLDNFKPLNDGHGHAAGDLLLIEVASRLKECVREADTVGRFGGDEFIVILNELDVDQTESSAQAHSVAEKIRASLSDTYHLSVPKEDKATIPVEHYCSASIGVIVFNHEFTMDDLLKKADAAMYQAKEAGRNQIRFYRDQN